MVRYHLNQDEKISPSLTRKVASRVKGQYSLQPVDNASDAANARSHLARLRSGSVRLRWFN